MDAVIYPAVYHEHEIFYGSYIDNHHIHLVGDRCHRFLIFFKDGIDVCNINYAKIIHELTGIYCHNAVAYNKFQNASLVLVDEQFYSEYVTKFSASLRIYASKEPVTKIYGNIYFIKRYSVESSIKIEASFEDYEVSYIGYTDASKRKMHMLKDLNDRIKK